MRTKTIMFRVPGAIRGQGRPRATLRAGHATVYESAEDRSYKGLIQHYAMEAMEKKGYSSPVEPDPSGFSVGVTVYKKFPVSFSRKRKERGYRLFLRPYRKPDVDNVAKIFLDAMNSVVYPDDRMVTQLHIAKVFSDIDSVYVTVAWEEAENAQV